MQFTNRAMIQSLAVTAIAVAGQAHAADVYWDNAPGSINTASDGGSGTWDTSTNNWDNGSNVIWNNASNDTAIFGGTTGTVTLGTNITVGGLKFVGTLDYEIASAGAETLTLASGTTFDSNIGSSVQNAPDIKSALVSTDGFTKTGTGRLGISASSSGSLSGDIKVQSGMLYASTTAVGSGDLVFTGDSIFSKTYGGSSDFGATLDIIVNSNVSATMDTITFFYDANYAGTVQGDTTTSLQLKLGGNTGLQFRNNANTFEGELFINGGGVNVNKAAEFNSMADSSQKLRIKDGTYRLRNGGVSTVFANRVLEMANGNAQIENASNDLNVILSFAQDLLASNGNNSKTLYLSGINTGDNTFGGVISNSDTGTGLVHVRKEKAGRWILSAANTYTGNTLVNSGTLVLADSGELRFDIDTAGVNNAITGTGTLNLNGDLVFDLSGASIVEDDLWNIVDVANLTATFGGTFGVRSTLGAFSESAGVWTISENAVTYQFDESTGVLSVVPEPGSLALLGLGGLLIGFRRRRG